MARKTALQIVPSISSFVTPQINEKNFEFEEDLMQI